MRFSYAVFLFLGIISGPVAFAQLRPLKVVATTTVVADLCRTIGGDRVTVTAVVGPDQDPHLFSPTYQDLALLRSADILVAVGLHFEGKMAAMLEEFAKSKPLISLASSIPPNLLIREQSPSAAADPHFWGDISLWARAGEYLAREFGEFDIGSRQSYLLRGQDHRRRMMRLHQDIARRLQAPPSGRRVLVTPHRSLAYFGAAYGWRILSLSGFTAETPKDAAAIATLSQQIADKKIAAVMTEKSLSSEVLDEVVAQSAERGFRVVMGGELRVDSLGPEKSLWATYEGMMLANVERLLAAVSIGEPLMPPPLAEVPPSGDVEIQPSPSVDPEE